MAAGEPRQRAGNIFRMLLPAAMLMIGGGAWRCGQHGDCRRPRDGSVHVVDARSGQEPAARPGRTTTRVMPTASGASQVGRREIEISAIRLSRLISLADS